MDEKPARSKRGGKYVFVSVSGKALEASAESFASVAHALDAKYQAGYVPHVNVVHWAPGKKMVKPLPPAVMRLIKRHRFATVAWAETETFKVYSIAAHRNDDPYPISKVTGYEVAAGRLIARLFEAWGYPDWRHI
jgi:hypothetical protein